MPHYVIIGASHAGISFAEKMRQLGSDDPITLIDRLPGLPLQRPPLSKAYLAADDEEAFVLRRKDWFDAQNINLRDGVEVTKINREALCLQLSDGTEQPYDKLILAQGAFARHLPMAEMSAKGVHVLRHGADARGLKQALEGATKAVVIGGGYIGLEAAASLRKENLPVTVIEAADRVLARVASPAISAYYEALHESQNVTISTGVGVASLRAEDGHIAAVCLSDGHEIPCDLLLVGIGVVPEIELAKQAGLTVGNGILTNHHYQTNDDAIFAIGDNVLAEGRWPIRVESIHNAQFGGHYLASRFTDGKPPVDEAPWFWSDQYDRKLQSAGLVPHASDELVQISRNGKREGSLSVWSFMGDALVSVEAVNDPQAYMIGKFCLEQGRAVPKDKLALADFDLKSLRA